MGRLAKRVLGIAAVLVLVVGVLPSAAADDTQRAAPANDDFVNRYDFANYGNDYWANGLQNQATTEFGELLTCPDSPGGAAAYDRTVWFEFTVNETRNVHIDTLGSDFDTVLAVYDHWWNNRVIRMTVPR